MSKYDNYLIELHNIQSTITSFAYKLSPKEWYNLQYRHIRILNKLTTTEPKPRFIPLSYVSLTVDNKPCIQAMRSYRMREYKDYLECPIAERLNHYKKYSTILQLALPLIFSHNSNQ